MLNACSKNTAGTISQVRFAWPICDIILVCVMVVYLLKNHNIFVKQYSKFAQ